jgi:hypothetical protein
MTSNHPERRMQLEGTWTGVWDQRPWLACPSSLTPTSSCQLTTKTAKLETNTSNLEQKEQEHDTFNDTRKYTI